MLTAAGRAVVTHGDGLGRVCARSRRRARGRRLAGWELRGRRRTLAERARGRRRRGACAPEPLQALFSRRGQPRRADHAGADPAPRFDLIETHGAAAVPVPRRSAPPPRYGPPANSLRPTTAPSRTACWTLPTESQRPLGLIKHYAPRRPRGTSAPRECASGTVWGVSGARQSYPAASGCVLRPGIRPDRICNEVMVRAPNRPVLATAPMYLPTFQGLLGSWSLRAHALRRAGRRGAAQIENYLGFPTGVAGQALAGPRLRPGREVRCRDSPSPAETVKRSRSPRPRWRSVDCSAAVRMPRAPWWWRAMRTLPQPRWQRTWLQT